MENHKREMITTADGSLSVAIPALGITYHSHHGAQQESQHIFIDAGLHFYLQQHPELQQIAVFEMGLGTGLNALLTAAEAERRQVEVNYKAVELFPLTSTEAESIDYPNLNSSVSLNVIHSTGWEKEESLSPLFKLTKYRADLLTFTTARQFDLVYFDAFGPEDQPLLWTEEIFRKMYALLQPGGLLLTYCSKSSVRKSMTAAGFSVTKLPGPTGKREIVRAVRPGPLSPGG